MGHKLIGEITRSELLVELKKIEAKGAPVPTYHRYIRGMEEPGGAVRPLDWRRRLLRTHGPGEAAVVSGSRVSTRRPTEHRARWPALIVGRVNACAHWLLCCS